MPGTAFYDGNLTLNRLPGYVQGSEWLFHDGVTFAGVYAANTVVTAKAAGGDRVKNIITAWEISAFAGGTAWVPFFFLLDGIALGANAANARWFYQKGLPITSGDNYHFIMPPDNPIIGTLNTAVSVISTGAGVAGGAVETIVQGYQIST